MSVVVRCLVGPVVERPETLHPSWGPSASLPASEFPTLPPTSPVNALRLPARPTGSRLRLGRRVPEADTSSPLDLLPLWAPFRRGRPSFG